MSAMSRRKGARGENELMALLSDALGFIVKRKIVNKKDDPDCIEIPGWALECKRVEKAAITQWWEQTERQAEKLKRKPILFYRASRQPWIAMVDLHDVNDSFPRGRFQVAMDFDAACQLIRDEILIEAIGD